MKFPLMNVTGNVSDKMLKKIFSMMNNFLIYCKE